MVRKDVATDFFALTRHFLGKIWHERYPEGNLRATGLKRALKGHFEQEDETACSLIRKFVGLNCLHDARDTMLFNRPMYVGSFCKGIIPVLQPHTLEFMVLVFNLAFQTIDQSTRARCLGRIDRESQVQMPAIFIDPAILQGYRHVCALICNPIQKTSAL